MVRDKILQLIVDWAAMYSTDPTLLGFQQFGLLKIQHSKHLRCPPPSISPGYSRGPSPGGYASPVVQQPLYSGYAQPMPVMQAAPRTMGTYKSPAQVSYGTKTIAPPGQGGMPPGFQTQQRHRTDFQVSDVEEFLVEVVADVEALTLGLERPDAIGDELPKLVLGLEKHRGRMTEILNRSNLPEPTVLSVCNASSAIDEVLTCYNAIYGDGSLEASSSLPPTRGADPMRYVPDGSKGDLPGAPTSPATPGAPGAHTNSARSLEGNATAERLGLVPPASMAAMGGATEELERLRAELKRKEANEQRLQRELDESQSENEMLKSQVESVSGTLTAEKKKGAIIPPHVLAALKAHAKQSKIMIKRHRDLQMELVGNVENASNRLNSNFQEAIAAMVTLSRRPNNEALIKKLQADYLKEMKLRKEYYNKIQELRGNIRVFCRVRPLSGREVQEHHATDVTSYPDADEIVITDDNARVKQKKYEFDRVYQPDESQEAVFVDTSPLIESVIDGYNVTIFAYGQTGSGKTYTMEGPSDNPGVYTRALKRLFQIIEEKADTEHSTVALSILEIYNETIKDLLVDSRTAGKHSYEVRTGGETGNYVQGLSQQHVNCIEDIDKWSAVAHENRSSGKTSMNEHSSRSHMILYFVVRTENIATGNRCYGKLSLIDLAGSERLKKSHAEGQAAKEASFINKSLSALGDTIAALASSSKHVPYRNSKLTFLLQDSLSGNSKVLMFANISPADYNTTETMSTLDFATRARNTALGMASKNKA
eukprot:TRINITY_DN2175_c0_g2_i1.p1 TRINITY_DN2175_c0_g2~~TRINITY_DN2175_c0_g2_i1.p1  ORF type:complete len:880 (+),score=295.06 TRINITY_DN2175_c0_g2_i1:340-2640(+)